MSEDEALFSAVERRDARGCYWDRDDADEARATGPQDGMGERGHDAFAIVGFKLQDGSRRMLEKNGVQWLERSPLRTEGVWGERTSAPEEAPGGPEN